MSEEVKEEQGFFGQLKTQIIGGVGILLTGIGTMFLDEVKSIVGIVDEEPSAVEAPAQNNQQSVSVTGPAITINVPEQKPQVVREVVREVPAAKPDTVVVEQPKETATSRLLKYKKGN